MLLLDRHGEKSDVWTRIETACEVGGDHVLTYVPELDALFAQDDPSRNIGVFIRNTEKVETLKPWLDRLTLIAIGFPSAADGRGFSLARQIRQQGYAGILRACGPLVSDQFPQALACGFDEVEIPGASAARQPVEQWVAALKRISLTYQSDFSAAGNILEQRRARKAGARNA